MGAGSSQVGGCDFNNAEHPDTGAIGEERRHAAQDHSNPQDGVRVSEAVRARMERKSSSVIEPLVVEKQKSLESDVDMCQRLEAQDQRWMQRLRCHRARYCHRRGICMENCERLMHSVEELQIPLNVKNPCSKYAAIVQDCYTRHKHDPLRCSDAVNTYADKVYEEMKVRTRKLGRESAVAKLSALDCDKIRTMNK